MKVRIGVGTGRALGPAELETVVRSVDQLGFDSIWLADILSSPAIDALVGLAWAAGANPRLKLGTTMLLPGRHVVRLARELAGLDALSRGRLLLTFVPGLGQAPERDLVGVAPDRRGAVIDEVLPLLRRLWAGETVTHQGEVTRFREVTISPLPVQDPLEVWLAGLAPKSLERCGRLADGWLPALCTPDEVVRGRRVIEEAAERAGRTIEAEHFGVSIAYAQGALDELDERTRSSLAARARGNPLEELVPSGLPALHTLLERFLERGFSKFVVRPLVPPVDWGRELERLAEGVLDLQT